MMELSDLLQSLYKKEKPKILTERKLHDVDNQLSDRMGRGDSCSYYFLSLESLECYHDNKFL